MSLRLYLHALHVARRRQLVGRATRPVRRRRFPRSVTAAPVAPLAANEELWRSAAFARLESSTPPGSRLAGFEQHYGEDVLELARAGGDAAGAAARWIARNPPRLDDAWHPYPLSTRISNWIAAATLDPTVAPVIAQSLAGQLVYLARNVEDDILGNHVIRNAKALVLGGAATGNDRLTGRGRALLARELPEQVLPDGGHYERSPAYHRLVLRDLLELQAFADVDAEVARMRAFAAASSRPDGAPALFNDGGLDIAPQLDLPAPPEGVAVFPDTGYVFVRDGDLWLAFDCGPPSPPFLPAHAHADALSLQLWWKGRAVLVDAGTYTYESGPDREYFRSTRAHSTVSVGDRDQFQLWGAFRAGPLPDVRLDRVDEGLAVATVRWPDGSTHRRTLDWSNRGVVGIHDRVEGHAGAPLASRLVPAPDLPAGVHVELAGEGAFEETAGWIAQRFGERSPTKVLSARVEAESGWTISLQR